MTKRVLFACVLLAVARTAHAATCTVGTTDSTTGAAPTTTLGGGLTDTACDYLMDGYYVDATPSIQLCPAGSYCLGGGTQSAAVANGAAVAAGGATTCPTGTSSAAVAAGTIGAYPAGAAGTSTSALSTCSLVAAGYYLPVRTGTAAACTKVASTGQMADTTGSCNYPIPCPAGSYCPLSTALLTLNAATITDIASGIQGVTSGTTNIVMLATAAVTTATNVACPTGFTNTLTGSLAQGINAVDASACKDIAPGYTVFGTGVAAVVSGSAVTPATLNTAAGAATAPFVVGANGVNVCAVGKYCPGQAGAIVFQVNSGSYYYVALTTTTAASFVVSCTAGSTTASTGTSAITGCSQLSPGYYIPSGAIAGSSPSACPAGSYCLGSSLPTPALASTITVAAAANFGATACPTGFTNSLTGSSAQGTNAVDASACKDIAPGYTVFGTGVAAVVSGSAVTPATLNTAAGAATTPFVVGANGVNACPAGSYCVGQANAIQFQVNSGNYYYAALTTTTAANFIVSCTANFGNGGTSAVSAATGCNSIRAGYYLQPGSTIPVACVAAAGSYCPGFSTGAYTGVTISTNAVTNTATTAAGVVSCPAGTTGTATAQASINAACTDLAAGYTFVPNVVTASLSSLIQACPTGATCAGQTGIFDDSTADGTLAPFGFVDTHSTPDLGAALVLVNSTAITKAVTTLLQGGTRFAVVNLGYFIAPFSYAPVACPAAPSYCAGGDIVGDSTSMVIPSPCPAGTTASSAVGCVINANFYAPTANTVAICAPNYYCPGTGYLGVAGGGFLCTANSTILVCNDFLDNIQSSSYAAGSTTIAASTAPNVTVGAPAVTVAAPAVTVTPAPITVAAPAVTVTPAAITVTPAPITINVPAPVVSAASTRSSALVLVMAAFAALAAF